MDAAFLKRLLMHAPYRNMQLKLAPCNSEHVHGPFNFAATVVPTKGIMVFFSFRLSSIV